MLYIFFYLLSIFNIIYLFLFFQKDNIVSLHSLASLTISKLVYLNMILMFLNFSGVPPLAMFFVKLQFLKLLWSTTNFFCIFLFLLLNVFSFIFYTNMFKYIQIKKTYKMILTYINPTYSIFYNYIILFVFFHIFWIINFCLIVTV